MFAFVAITRREGRGGILTAIMAESQGNPRRRAEHRVGLLHPKMTMKPEDLLLADVLDFQPGQGIIRLHEQRVVILSATAMGLLRRELIEALGINIARRLLLRFGFADGYHDAVNLRDQSS